MTALFCDLVNSVGLSERLDPEDLMRVYDLYRELCEEVIASHGGYLAQYLGDGILAFFGYPKANEDDAANAVRAGLELPRRVAILDAGLDPPLQARVGIATGLVVVTDPVGRGAAATPGIVGQMPNLAARLQSLAAPGSVVISDATRRLTRGRFTYRDLGATPLKGFTRPVRAWEVVASTEVESRLEAHVQGAASPFVGRRDEFETLARAWTEVKAGSGRVSVIVGEPGIGKSRLIEAFEGRVAADPHIRLRWFCSPQHVESPLFPVIDQLERAAAIDRFDSAPARLEKLAALLGSPDETTLATFADLLSIPLGRPSIFDSVTPEQRKEETLLAVLAMLTRLSRATPVLLVVEDVHWMDASSLELMDRLVTQAETRAIALVVTARPEFTSRWSDVAAVTELRLERLDAASAQALCAHVAGDSLPAEVLRRILERGEGNPLFVEELTRSVVESLSATGERSPASADGAVVIPQTLHDSLVARLDRLGPARAFANVGAVIGRRFTHALLAAVAGRPAGEVRVALRRLVQARLVNEIGDAPRNSYLFRHALIRDAAYDSLLRADRQALHAKIASALLETFPEQADAEPEVTAFHLSQGGAEAQAIPYWEKAGRRAASRAAHEVAIGHFTTALEGVRRQPDDLDRQRRELSLLIPLARSLASTRGYVADAVREVLTLARDLCDRCGEVAELFPVLRGLCTNAIVRGDMPFAEELARRCIEIGDETGHPPYRIEGEAGLGYVLFSLGDYRAGREHLERTLRLYHENAGAELTFPSEQDPGVSAGCLLGTLLHHAGDVSGARQAVEEALALARRLGRPFEVAYALPFAATNAMLSGDFQTAMRLAEEGVEIAETYGFRSWSLTARMNVGCAKGFMGDVEEAIEVVRPILATWLAEGHRHSTALMIGQLASFLATAGRLAEARSTIDEAIALAHGYNDLSFLSGLHMIRASITAKASPPNLERVAGDLRQAVSIAQAQGAAGLEAQARARLERIEGRLRQIPS